MRLPDPDRSAVLLIGTSRYDVPSLDDLPAVANNLAGLAAAFTDPEYGVVRPDNCRVLAEPANPGVISKALRDIGETADDALIVYFAGHGLLGMRGELFLALPGSDPEDPAFTALPYEALRALFVDSSRINARTRIIILDCCFSGRAIPAMSDGQVSGMVDIEGVYVLTATAANRKALAPPGERYTAFTGALLELLRDGVPDGPELLSLDVIFTQLHKTMRRRSLPHPEQVNVRTAAGLALRPNPAARAERAGVRTAAAPRPVFAARPERPATDGPRRSDAHPVFFVSHARADVDDRHTRFFVTLSGYVNELMGLGAGEDSGFIDATPDGRWTEEVAFAVGHCQVFVPLLSPRYVNSPRCAQEWDAFTRRVRSRSDRPGWRTSIIPVMWTVMPIRDLPRQISAVQVFSPTGLPDHSMIGMYEQEGLYGLSRLGPTGREAFDVIVWRLAQHIVRTADERWIEPDVTFDVRQLRTGFDRDR
ncbi:TIR domain-containing protein [Dactylosporangium aurantiacum]|uniref:TIR domain-containing protein n=1 Tax=Dactylosporangium aurantiacum TaxID=35754 RepID=A0A9Q9MK51_9ACTN|nr:TIR-like protein FxsC [Dactylosporangium aurantiacum]MDG6103099.1 TIR-like protein FxsC [Dactylosporangium aurantiacum]UWZ57610.1 TIR domain-containing protein [Dactylosporangium aurantiacum]